MNLLLCVLVNVLVSVAHVLIAFAGVGAIHVVTNDVAVLVRGVVQLVSVGAVQGGGGSVVVVVVVVIVVGVVVVAPVLL